MRPETTFGILRDGSRRCGRAVPDSEILAAVRTAYRSEWTPSSRTSIRPIVFGAPSSSWPQPDQRRIAEIVAEGATLLDLREASPIAVSVESLGPEEIIDHLFPGNPLLCVARRVPRDAKTARRSAWRDRLQESALMVPSPMSAMSGVTKDGRHSMRCLANTGPRRFLVIEFDTGDLDSQAARLMHLKRMAALTLAVHSGGKSIHGWFYCQGIPEEMLVNFMRRCVGIGADPAMWNRCQLVRIPGGTRDNGQMQRVLYFNPDTAPKHD